MPDWLTGAASTADSAISIQHAAVRLLMALVMGTCVALVFRLSHGVRHERINTLTTTLILLSALIAMVSLVVGGSVALAFSLVGALSIVRFRTVVEDTRDTAFVIFAVVVGMAAGAGQFAVAFVGLPLVGVAAIVLSRLQSGDGQINATVTVRVALSRTPETMAASALKRHCSAFSLTTAATAKQGAALELTWHVMLTDPGSIVSLITDLQTTEGIQYVEIRRA